MVPNALWMQRYGLMSVKMEVQALQAKGPRVKCTSIGFCAGKSLWEDPDAADDVDADSASGGSSTRKAPLNEVRPSAAAAILVLPVAAVALGRLLLGG